jgi:hypothetical protein
MRSNLNTSLAYLSNKEDIKLNVNVLSAAERMRHHVQLQLIQLSAVVENPDVVNSKVNFFGIGPWGDRSYEMNVGVTAKPATVSLDSKIPCYVTPVK